jgi:hypothetical protein
MADQLIIRGLARRAAVVHESDLTALLHDCAARMGVRRPVRLLRSSEKTMPMAFGVFRPNILIPAAIDTWDEDRRQAVLLHELAHVGRADCLTQTIAACACALYWPHPGVWWMARRMRIDRELACDDRVLAMGASAREYAGHLLELAYTLSTRRAPALAVMMARPRQLEGRLLAVLDAARNRTTPEFRWVLAGVALLAAVLIPLAGARAAIIPGAAASISDVAPSTRTNAFQSRQASAGAKATADDRLPGTWRIRPTDAADMVYLELTEGATWSHGTSVPLQLLDGLAPALLNSTDGGSARFMIRRDAGTFTFDGVFRSRVGAGTFAFTPSTTFGDDLAKRGIGRPAPDDYFALAMNDVGFSFLDELTTQGYKRPDIALLVRAAQSGVQYVYLREMGRLGYRLNDLEMLIRQRQHGVGPEYIRALAEQGLKSLSADDLIRARSSGMSPEYIRELRALGYQNLSLDALIGLRNNGISPEEVRELRDLGYQNLTLDTLTKLRNNGVSPDEVRELHELGYRNLTIPVLIALRNNGVSPDEIRELGAIGYRNLPIDALIRLRNNGVDPDYIGELKALGYERLSVDELVGLRNHGVTADQVRRANARAGSRLSVEMLKSAASNGWR